MSCGGAGAGPTAGNTSVDADANPDGSPCPVDIVELTIGVLSPPAVEGSTTMAALIGVAEPSGVVSPMSALVGSVVSPPAVGSGCGGALLLQGGAVSPQGGALTGGAETGWL
ncbi:hypothetical protein GCM10009848_53550 [Micromonospora lupini]